MTAKTMTTNATITFTRSEQRALRELRNRYRQDRDLFSAGELARLRFLRWLNATGRLVP